MLSLSYLLLLGSLLRLVQSIPLEIGLQVEAEASNQRPVSKLQGRFLHITDLHPDPYYEPHTSTAEDSACHWGEGPAGYYGTETSDCDAPFALINETFRWISQHIKDEVDFVVWTGDSSRHDSDEKVPRTTAEVIRTNIYVAAKFAETFGNGLDPANHNHTMMIPVIPTFGNNDFLPHNIFYEGPNKWLKTYVKIWDKFIPEEQRHGFERGGWFYVEAIPNKLAVFSLNTMYFFSHNAAVDGCSIKSEPGFEHMEWLRIQLQAMRDRGMKAILTGHVPPARTESKELWDESCWQKYTLYLQQFRDVVIVGLYGHMNIDHFITQDTKELDLTKLQGQASSGETVRSSMGDELNINSATDYLEELREDWADLPTIPLSSVKRGSTKEISNTEENDNRKTKGKRSRENKQLKKIGGPWGERFQVTIISPSIVPNYFPTLRIFEYNTTGLDVKATWASHTAKEVATLKGGFEWDEDIVRLPDEVDSVSEGLQSTTDDVDAQADNRKKGGKKHKKKKNSKDPNLTIPPPPTKGSPPGPAYSPQTFTLLGYSQYFVNLTSINNDTGHMADLPEGERRVDEDRWRPGKHQGRKPKDNVPHPKKFAFEIEYETFSDKTYKLKDLTVISYLRLAYRMGQYKPAKGDSILSTGIDERFKIRTQDDSDSFEEEGRKNKRGGKDHKKKKKKKKKKQQHENNKVWLAFIERAFVSTRDANAILSINEKAYTFSSDNYTEAAESHDGEL